MKETFLELVIARHGETEYNVKGLVNSSPAAHCPLTEKGREQAVMLGTILRDGNHVFDAIFCSRLPRTIETLRQAMPFAEFSVNRYLDEVHTGVCESQSHTLFKEMIDNSVEKKPLGGESFNDVCARFKQFWDLMIQTSLKKILIIGHSDTVRAAHVIVGGGDPHEAKFVFQPQNGLPYFLESNDEL